MSRNVCAQEDIASLEDLSAERRLVRQIIQRLLTAISPPPSLTISHDLA